MADVERKRGAVQPALALYRDARVALRHTLEETHEEVQMIDMAIGLCLKVPITSFFLGFNLLKSVTEIGAV